MRASEPPNSALPATRTRLPSRENGDFVALVHQWAARCIQRFSSSDGVAIDGGQRDIQAKRLEKRGTSLAGAHHHAVKAVRPHVACY